jgi:DNA-binding SARP family transcriptional activator/tetratricopeptide (TPR) repeat protein
MIYRLLGDLEIGREGGLINLPGGPTLNLLAALVVNANRQLSAAELIRAAWGSSDVTTAQLYKRVNHVRVILKQIGRSQDLKTHSRSGYELRAAPEDVDSLLFQRLVRDAAKADAEQRIEDEIGLLRQALHLWRGPHPLSNVPSQAFHQEAVALERRRKRAAARLFDLELARGNHGGILDELILTAGSYPSDGRLCEQLMLAEYRCGHLADVSEAYERHRDALEEHTAAEPEVLLRDFHFAAARGDAAAGEAVEGRLAARTRSLARPVVTVPQQLPSPADLVGRGDLVAEVSWLLRRPPGGAAPVVVISGPGGIGKTALAVRAAHEITDHYPDGQLYAELRGTNADPADTGELLAQFLRAFGVPRVPDTTAERLSAYRTLLADRRVLLVLDDVADGTQASQLVPAGPRCAVIVTARQRLPEISGAHHVAALEPLRPADATELFMRVISDSGIQLDADLAAVGKVISLCGGLPLALRIAAALRVHDHPRPTAELADRLARQGPAAFSYGELSLSRTIGVGFERLGAEARQLFLGLGLLPLSSFGLWTAAALLGDGGADTAGPALSQLAARFMVETLEPQIRYRFHDLTAEYARRRALADYPGDRDAVPARVYRALLTLTRRAHHQLYGGDFEVVHSPVPGWEAPPEALAEVDASPLDWFEKERLNIRAAVADSAALGLTGICWDLAVSAHEFYTIGGYFDDWFATHAIALNACRQAHDRQGEGIVLACLSQPALVASRRIAAADALGDLQAAAGLLAACGDRHGQAIALRSLGNALRRQGHLTQPLALFRKALAHYKASGDTVGCWQALRFIGQASLDRGAHDDARRALEQAQSLATELGSARLIAQTQYWNGQACLTMGDLGGAQRAFDAVLQAYPDASGIGHAYAAHGLGDLARHKGAHAIAEQRLAVAADLARDGDAVLEGRVWLSRAALYRDQDQPDEQAVALQHAAAVFAQCGAAHLEIDALAELAQVTRERGDAAAAAAASAHIDELYQAADVPAQDRIYQGPSN